MIVGVLSLLAVLPPFFQKRHFSFPLSESPAVAFPLETPLKRVVSETKLTPASLKELAQAAPNGILVNFWATWCPPCVEELPSLEHLNRQLGLPENVKLPRLVTVSVDDKPADIFALYKTLEFSPTFTVLYDAEGTLARSVGTTKFPETYWVNAEGKVLHKWVGPQDWLAPDVLSKIRELATL